MNTKRLIVASLIAVLLATLGATAYAQTSLSEASANRNKLVGTWLIDIPQSDGGAPPFQALHTFNDDGTFVETSSLLGQGAEGPAHGVWKRDGKDYALTFELFIFDENGQSVGRARVRCDIEVEGNHLSARYAVDIIDPAGVETRDIDTGTFEGTRMKVQPLP
jgi:hypothetical protein